jgi:hypothetical protein
MLTIKYIPSGSRISDIHVESWVYKQIEKYNKSEVDMELCVANELIILAFRVAVRENKISHNEVCFIKENNTANVDKHGSIDNELFKKSTYIDFLYRLIFT